MQIFDHDIILISLEKYYNLTLIFVLFQAKKIIVMTTLICLHVRKNFFCLKYFFFPRSNVHQLG
jgi:hypothetical protein